jgi:WD40 repeat protein
MFPLILSTWSIALLGFAAEPISTSPPGLHRLPFVLGLDPELYQRDYYDFSPDGRYLALFLEGTQPQILCYDTETEKKWGQVLSKNQVTLSCYLRFLSGGSILGVTDKGCVFRWYPGQEKPLWQRFLAGWEGHEILGELDPQGRYLFAVRGTALHIFDLVTARQIAQAARIPAKVHRVLFAEQADRIVIWHKGDSAEEIRCQTRGTWRLEKVLKFPKDTVQGVWLSPSGQELVVWQRGQGKESPGQLLIWDLAIDKKTIVASLPGRVLEMRWIRSEWHVVYEAQVMNPRLMQDLLLTELQVVQLHSGRSWSLPLRFLADRPERVRLAPSGRRMAFLKWSDTHLWLWDFDRRQGGK